jgi:ELWxxDGT repeat protein
MPAQTASLVRDLAPDLDRFAGRGGLQDLVVAGDKVFFLANESSAGLEPWVSDGTASGTRLLADICPGPCPSEIRMLGNLGGVALWVARASSNAALLLWGSDGTRSGTYPLLLPTANVYSEISQAFFGGAFYLNACRDEECGLWRTDGTPEGTQRISDVRPYSLAPAAGRMFFQSGLGIWVTDGTPAGTRLVKTLTDLVRSPGRLTAMNDRVFFGAATPADGEEVWTSDGTEAGTRPVTRLPSTDWEEPFGYGFDSLRFAVAGGEAYFVVDDIVHGAELWRSDGTPEGTRPITDFGYNDAVSSHNGTQAAKVGGRVLFLADDGLTANRLWTTDGNPASAAPLACTGTCPTDITSDLVPIGGRVVFLSQGPYREEIWTSDGTQAGTRLLVDTCPGCQSLDTRILHVTSREVVFAARGPHGYAFWKTDGTAAGTERLSSFLDLDLQYPESAWNGRKVYFAAPSPPYGEGLWESTGPESTRLIAAPWPGAESSTPMELAEDRGRLVFSACAAGLRSVWQSAGTFESTAELAPPTSDFQDCDDPIFLTPAAGLLFYRGAIDFYHGDLWRTDGTPAGTVQLTAGGDVGDGFAELGGRLYFGRGAADDESGAALWKSDGTLKGTVQAVALPVGNASITDLTRLGSELYFTTLALDALRVWRSDGTAAGTRELLKISGTSFFYEAPEFTRAGPWVYFVVGRGGGPFGGGRIWKTDGTAAGTTALSDAQGGQGGANPIGLAAFNNVLYYFAHSEGERQLWRTDGTAAGTKPLQDFAPASIYDPYAPNLTVAAGRLFFTADDGDHGLELWASDGTAAGTSLVRDILPGAAGSRPAWLRGVGDKVYFSAGDGIHGWELWVSDGTAAGTRLAQDIAPLGTSSNPERLTVAGDRLYFTADDGVTGRELWSMPLASPAVCVPSATVLCLGGGRFRVEARWRDFEGHTGLGQAAPVTADTGTFWFFSPSNVEVIVKVLDGRGLNGHRWVFYGALSSVEYTLVVTDTETGLTQRYFNPAGQLSSFADTQAFGPLGAAEKRAAEKRAAEKRAAKRATVVAPPSPPVRAVGRLDAAATGACQATATRLCLQGGRFAVEASWKDFQGHTGQGQAVSLSGDTGYFWFFGADNVEVVLKVLDGTALNGKHWVFYGALSSVEYRLTVTDTETGKIKTYDNPGGRLASVADTAAF